MISNQNSYINSAFQQLEIISQDKQKRLEYEAREKAIRDHNQEILEAVLRGKKKAGKRAEKKVKKRAEKKNDLKAFLQRFQFCWNLIQNI